MGKVEEVARAIAKAQTQTESMWQAFLPEARAAIAAMREPTHHMIKAGGNAQTVRARANRWVCYRAMIDAALSEDKEQG